MMFLDKYNAERHIDQLQEDFRREDAFRNDFIASFKQSVHLIITSDSKHPVLPIGLPTLTETYALTVLSIVSSVLDKNESSPFYRINDEIKALQSYIFKYEYIINNTLSKKVFEQIEEIISTKFPQVSEITELSNQLLTVNLQWHHINYMASFPESK